jgi:hypothetical protein
VVINGYYINGYWWLFYWWLLMPIDGYSIGGYLYYKLLLDNML